MLRAVHFVIDSQQADRLRAAWPPDARVSLEFVDRPGRSLPSVPPTWSAMRQNCRAQVTVVMPRRNFAPLRDGTAGQIADVLGQVPDVAVTIIPLSRAAPESGP
jgi:hypothetical protein